jgi:predicted regulator of Ras-like GTPase activity (Roadblock/LC7/MglB family)
MVPPAYRSMGAAPITPIAPAAPITPIAPAAPIKSIASITPIAPIVPATPITPIVRAVPRETAASRPPVTPSEPVPQPGRPAFEVPSLAIPLMSLAEGWPEALRQEIGQLNLMDAKVAIPVEAVELALKRGKVAFPWKALRSWIKPSPPPTVSVYDNALLELPLKVLAPLFLNRQQVPAKTQQKVAIDGNIPNLFFGFPQPGASAATETPAPPAVSHAVSKPTDTNYYIWDDNADGARPQDTELKRKAAASPGTSFVSRCATPNEVVSRAAALDGVAGALIALPDGLMVASRLAQDLNGDTLAAFLPHIFSKVSQCTKELRMGELNNLNFTVGNVPWKIFRVNAIFFAAFGRPGQPLPTAQLAALASELDRKKQ